MLDSTNTIICAIAHETGCLIVSLVVQVIDGVFEHYRWRAIIFGCHEDERIKGTDL